MDKTMTFKEQEELVKALETIKKVSIEHSCDDCPINDATSNCFLGNLPPSMWAINPPDSPWEAFIL